MENTIEQLVDFHCHLDLYKDFENLIYECEKNSIYTLGVTTTPRAWEKNFLLTKNLKFVRCALGLHPQLVEKLSHEINLFCQLLPQCKYVGEVGIDGSIQHKGNIVQQTDILKTIFDCCANNGGKIISLHSRGAASLVLDCIEEKKDAGTFILHWFSGSLKELERAIALDCWFSIGPAMLSGKKGMEIAGRIPRNRILTETDGPFASNTLQQPYRPKDVKIAVQKISEVWQLDYLSAKNMIFLNLKNLLINTE